MKKKVLYGICIVWLVVLAQFTAKQWQKQENVVVETMAQLPLEGMETYLEVSGKYPRHLEAGQRERLMMNLAESLGVHTDYDIITEQKKNGDVTIFQKNGANGQVILKYLTIRAAGVPENYLVMEVTIYNTIDYALDYRKKMQDLCENYQVDATVCMELTGEYDHSLSTEEKKQAEQMILKETQADFVTGNRKNDLYTVYGYSGIIDSYLLTDYKKTNINIAFTQTGRGNTVCHVGIPVLRQDY